MILAYIVYFFLMISMSFSAYIANKKKLPINIFAIIIASIILGHRYFVGIDYEAYLLHYINQNRPWVLGEFELGFEAINRFLFWCGFPPGIFFSTTIAIQFSFLYIGFRKSPKVLPWGIIFFFLTGQLFGQLNIVRQAIVFCIFFYSIKYIVERKFISYLCFLLLAFSFHYSAIILLPFYWIPSILNSSFFSKKNIQLLLLIVVSIFSEIIFNGLVMITETILSQTIYFNYVPNLGIREMRLNSGIGLMLFFVCDMIIILYSDKVKRYYSEQGFAVYYGIYFTGLLLSKIFGLDMLLSRISYCMISLRFVILAFLLNFIASQARERFDVNHLIAISLLLIFSLIFLVDIWNGSSGCSPYKFIPL
jgi:hypothetical protein